MGLQGCEIEGAIEGGGLVLRIHADRHRGDLGRVRQAAMQGVPEEELKPALP
jgi:hypothetical protein